MMVETQSQFLEQGCLPLDIEAFNVYEELKKKIHPYSSEEGGKHLPSSCLGPDSTITSKTFNNLALK